MNLAAYDIVTRLDRKKTWIDPKYNRLYSREIKTNRDYFAFSKTYNPETSKYDINLILLDELISGSTYKIIDIDYLSIVTDFKNNDDSINIGVKEENVPYKRERPTFKQGKRRKNIIEDPDSSTLIELSTINNPSPDENDLEQRKSKTFHKKQLNYDIKLR